MNKQMRYSDKELELIKTTFAEDEELLKEIRRVFLQMEKPSKRVLGLSDDAKKVLRKSFLPQLEGDAPVHQVIDLYLTVDIKEKSPQELYEAFHARKKLIEYLDQQMKVIEGDKAGKIKFTDFMDLEGKTALEVFIDANVRNTTITHVEQQLSQLQILAGTPDESVEEMKERLLQDSAK